MVLGILETTFIVNYYQFLCRTFYSLLVLDQLLTDWWCGLCNECCSMCTLALLFHKCSLHCGRNLFVECLWNEIDKRTTIVPIHVLVCNCYRYFGCLFNRMDLGSVLFEKQSEKLRNKPFTTSPNKYNQLSLVNVLSLNFKLIHYWSDWTFVTKYKELRSVETFLKCYKRERCCRSVTYRTCQGDNVWTQL